MKPTIRTLLTNRNFMLLWCAYGISAMGDHISEMALLAHQGVLDPKVEVTPLMARMTFLLMLPFFVLGPVTGALADRFSRRWIMIVADVARAGIMVGFIFLIEMLGRVWPEWGPYLPLLLVGVFASAFSPARGAMVPMLVGSEELLSANAMIGGLGLIATMFAQLISGELAERGWIETAFDLDAGTYALSAVCVFLISVRGVRPQDSSHREPFFRSILEGFRYVACHRRVAQLIGIAVVFWFCGATVKSVAPAIVKDVYEGGFREMARFPAWIGLGLACGAAAVLIAGRALRGSIVIMWSLIGVGFSIVLLAGSVFLPIGPVAAHVAGVISAVMAGFFGAGVMVSYTAMLQRLVPDHYRGRVFGLLDVATIGALLIATGSLTIPKWEGLDRSVGYIVAGVAVVLLTTATLTLVDHRRSSVLTYPYSLIRDLIEAVAKFWYRLERGGTCTIPRAGPVIVTANHGCPIDPLLVYATCGYREVSFMIAAEYCNIPVAKYIVRCARCIPVRRWMNDISATKAAMRRLRDGDALGVFIQGGIRNRGEEDQLKNGVALMALRTGATVIPAHISGTRYDESMLRSFFGRHRARIRFGPAVDLDEFKKARGHEALEGATQRIFNAIEALAPAEGEGSVSAERDDDRPA